MHTASEERCHVEMYTRDSAIRARDHTGGVKGAAPRLGKRARICTHEIISRVYTLAETLTSRVSVAFVTSQTIAPDTDGIRKTSELIAHVRVTIRARLILLG